MLGTLHSNECLLVCLLILQCACTFAFLGENHCKEMACYADYNNAPKARWQGNYKNQRYVGTFSTVGQCETACVNYQDRRRNKCYSFVWFDAPESGCLARKDCLTGQCFAIIDDTWDPVEHKGAISGRIGLAASSVVNKAFVTVANLTDTLSGGISDGYSTKTASDSAAHAEAKRKEEENARKVAEEAKKKAAAEEAAKKKAAAEEAAKKKATAEEAAKKKAAAEEAAKKAAAKKAEEAKRNKKSNKQGDSESSWYAWTNTMSPEQIITPGIAAIVIASLIAYSMKDSKTSSETPSDPKNSSSKKTSGNAQKQQTSGNTQKKSAQTKLGAAVPSKQSKEETSSQPFDFITKNILLGSSAPAPAAKETTTSTTTTSSSASAKPEQKKAEKKTASATDFAAKRSFWQLKASTPDQSPSASSPSKKSKSETEAKEGKEEKVSKDENVAKSSNFLPNIDLFKLPLPNLIPNEESAKYRKLEEDRRKKNAIDDEGAWLL